MTTKIKARGNRGEVWAGTARRTSGNLTKDDLILNSRGKLVSKKQSETAKINYPTLKAKLCASTSTPTQAPPTQALPPSCSVCDKCHLSDCSCDADALEDIENERLEKEMYMKSRPGSRLYRKRSEILSENEMNEQDKQILQEKRQSKTKAT